jgi:hypothetical protein
MERLTIEDFIAPSNTRGFSNHRMVIRYRKAAAAYLSRKVEERLPQSNIAGNYFDGNVSAPIAMPHASGAPLNIPAITSNTGQISAMEIRNFAMDILFVGVAVTRAFTSPSMPRANHPERRRTSQLFRRWLTVDRPWTANFAVDDAQT